VQATTIDSVSTLDARFLHHQQQMLLEQQRQLLDQQQRQLAARQHELAQRLASSSSDRPSVSSYQMHSILLAGQQQQQQQQVPHSRTLVAPSTPNLMTTELIGVDCIRLSTSGRYVVTGSIVGPPQVWDLKVAFCCPGVRDV